MAGTVVPLHRRGEEEHRDAPRPRRGRIGAPLAVSGHCHWPVIWARIAAEGILRELQSVAVLAVYSAQMPRLTADLSLDVVARERFVKPVGRREDVEDVKENRAGGAGTDQAWSALSLGIARPHAYGVVGRDAHGPGIPEAIARTRLPCDLSDGGDQPPVHFIWSVDFLERIEGPPHGCPVIPRTFRLLQGVPSIRRRGVFLPLWSL